MRVSFLIALVTLACLQSSSARAMRGLIAVENQLSVAVTSSQPVQRPGYIEVEGPNLNSRIEAAIKLGRAGSTRFWTAYSFDGGHGVWVGVVVCGGGGS